MTDNTGNVSIKDQMTATKTLVASAKTASELSVGDARNASAVLLALKPFASNINVLVQNINKTEKPSPEAKTAVDELKTFVSSIKDLSGIAVKDILYTVAISKFLPAYVSEIMSNIDLAFQLVSVDKGSEERVKTFGSVTGILKGSLEEIPGLTWQALKSSITAKALPALIGSVKDSIDAAFNKLSEPKPDEKTKSISQWLKKFKTKSDAEREVASELQARIEVISSLTESLSSMKKVSAKKAKKAAEVAIAVVEPLVNGINVSYESLSEIKYNKESLNTASNAITGLQAFTKEAAKSMLYLGAFGGAAILLAPFIAVGFGAIAAVLEAGAGFILLLSKIKKKDVAQATNVVKSVTSMFAMLGLTTLALAAVGYIATENWQMIGFGMLACTAVLAAGLAVVGALSLIGKANLIMDVTKGFLTISLAVGSLLAAAFMLQATGDASAAIDWASILGLTGGIVATGAAVAAAGLALPFVLPGAIAIVVVAGALLAAGAALNGIGGLKIAENETKINSNIAAIGDSVSAISADINDRLDNVSLLDTIANVGIVTMLSGAVIAAGKAIQKIASINIDWEGATSNAKRAITSTLEGVTVGIKDYPELFSGDTLWSNSPAMVAVNCVKTLAGSLKNLSNSIKGFIGKGIDYELGSLNAQKVITCLLAGIMSVSSNAQFADIFDDGLFSDSPGMTAVKSVNELGKGLDGLSKGITKFAEQDTSAYEIASKNAADTITTLLKGVMAPINEYPELFETRFFGGEAPAAVAIQNTKTLGEAIQGLVGGIEATSKMDAKANAASAAVKTMLENMFGAVAELDEDKVKASKTGIKRLGELASGIEKVTNAAKDAKDTEKFKETVTAIHDNISDLDTDKMDAMKRLVGEFRSAVAAMNDGFGEYAEKLQAGLSALKDAILGAGDISVNANMQQQAPVSAHIASYQEAPARTNNSSNNDAVVSAINDLERTISRVIEGNAMRVRGNESII